MTSGDIEHIEGLHAAASPPPVVVVQLPEDQLPLGWIARCLNKNTQHAVYGVAQDTLDIHEEAIMLAITGNGPTSRANAEFYMACHTAIPALVTECRRLQGLLDEREAAPRAASGVVTHWNEFGTEYDLAEWMDRLDKALNTLRGT